MKLKFITKANYLTHYALSCGYVELAENTEGFSTQMVWDSCSYRVTCYDGDNNRLQWNNYHSITEARKDFKNLCKKYNLIKRKHREWE